MKKKKWEEIKKMFYLSGEYIINRRFHLPTGSCVLIEFNYILSRLWFTRVDGTLHGPNIVSRESQTWDTRFLMEPFEARFSIVLSKAQIREAIVLRGGGVDYGLHY